MTFWHEALAVTALIGLGTHAVPAQEFLCLRRNGEVATVELRQVHGRGSDQKLVLGVREPAGGRRQDAFDRRDILALCGPSPKVARLEEGVVARLVGGAMWRGRLRGGDANGDTLTLESVAFGAVQLRLDRLEVLWFPARSGAVTGDRFRPTGEQNDELLFRPARRGFDVLGGGIDRFGADAVWFAPSGQSPRSFLYRDVVAIGVRGGEGAKDPGTVRLLTTAGDWLLVELDSVADGRLHLSVEGRPLSMPLSMVAGLAFRGPDRTFLSDLPVERADERGMAAGSSLGSPDAMFPFQRDRTCSLGLLHGGLRNQADGMLVADGRAYVKGIGVHARSALTFRVPAGATRFVCRVAMDDEVAALPIRGNADVRIRSGERILFERQGIESGMQPITVDVAVVPQSLVTLEVTSGKGLFLGDRVDWLCPVFLVQ